jgi:hypothetical protein
MCGVFVVVFVVEQKHHQKYQASWNYVHQKRCLVLVWPMLWLGVA